MEPISEKNLIIDQKWLDQNKNEKAEDSVFDRAVDYTNEAKGAYRTLQVVQKTAKLGNEIGKEGWLPPSPVLGHLDHKAGIGASALGLARLPSATKGAIESLSALKQNDNGIGIGRKVGKAIRDMMDAIASYSYAAVFIKKNPTIQTVAQVTDLTSDLADLQISASNYLQASKLESKATGEVKNALSHSRKTFLWRVAKDVSGIAAASLGFVSLAFGAPLMPAIAWIIVSLSTTLIAIARDVHKDIGTYKVIDFDRKVTVI